MFDSNWDAGQAIYLAIIVVAIAAIMFLLIRAFRRNGERPWSVFFVGIYNIFLLLLYVFGMMTQESSEGFGFLPLMVFTTPWSWLVLWLCSQIETHVSNFLGPGLEGTFLSFFLACNILAASLNSGILYFLLKRRQRKQAEDEAWEQARRNR